MENVPQSDAAADKDTGRMEAFSDGVFSIAMTLLVLELKVPAMPAVVSARWLWGELCQQWPSYFAFLTSFATVLIMWVNHHGIFRLVRRTNGNLLFTNGFLLLLVTVVPFPTALVAAYIKTSAASTVCAVYSGLFVLISISYSMVLLAARHGGHLLVDGSLPEVNRRLRNCLVVGFPFYLSAAGLAWVSPWLSMGICSALWIYWIVVSVETGRSFCD